jgi:regulatory protein
MKITKFSDEISESFGKNILKITKIMPAAKTAGRYNIFINEKYSFSLDELQLANLRLKKGDAITSEKLTELKNDSDFGKNYISALDLISHRVRSEKEIRDYGFRKNWTRENIEKVVERLREKKYLDDEKFAQSFVNSRANLRNFSKRKMEIELMKKGISREIIAKIIMENENFDEQNSLKNLIAKKHGNYENDQKLIAYLAQQGFAFYDIKNALAEFYENF